MNPLDIPSPIDFRIMEHARDLESKAMDRPFRLDMFEKFAECIAECSAKNVLELGSGPGFLAEFLCTRNPDISLTLLDFSKAMHELAGSRLARYDSRVTFITEDFKESAWSSNMAHYDCVITNQAVHELRHKRHASVFHSQVRDLLLASGVYLVCDHFCGEGGMPNSQLYMSVGEHVASLEQANFEVEVLRQKGSLVFLRAT